MNRGAMNMDSKQDHERLDDEHLEDESNIVDSEWADFENFLRSVKQRRVSTTSSIDEELRSRRHTKVQSQAFYPCPPTLEQKDSDSSSDDDPFGYVDTIVSSNKLIFLH